MARKPSERTNRIRPDDTLNLTPLIDLVTCLMFFLLIFAGIIPVAIIDAPLPKSASTAEEVKMAQDNKNTLDLTVDISPTNLVLREEGGATRTFPVAQQNGKYDLKAFHDHLVGLKTRRPKSKEITILPTDTVTYELMIQVMDASRELMPGDAGYQQLPPGATGTLESTNFNRLFPEVSLGGV